MVRDSSAGLHDATFERGKRPVAQSVEKCARA